MISYLKGILASKTATTAEIECGGIAYQCFISLQTSQNLPQPGEVTKLLTVLIPREDSLTLYGFFESTERETFKLLIGVNGIGPKTALAVLSALAVSDFVSYILTGNLNGLQKLPGIGRKTAERMILELKDKVVSLHSDSETEDVSPVQHTSVFIRESVLALISLGYSNQVAEKLVKSALQILNSSAETEVSTENLLKTALKMANK